MPSKKRSHTEEWQRHTVQLKIRCHSELADQARALAKKLDVSLAVILMAGVAHFKRKGE